MLLVSILLFGLSGADAQINRSGIKKSNKRVGSYKGTINSFGKQNIYNSLGFSLIAINYYGDLSPNPGKLSTDISFTKPGFSFSYNRRIGPRLSLQGQFMFATLKGSDA